MNVNYGNLYYNYMNNSGYEGEQWFLPFKVIYARCAIVCFIFYAPKMK